MDGHGGAGQVRAIALRAKDASRRLAQASTQQKNDAVHRAAVGLRAAAAEVIAENAADVAAAPGLAPALVDRLRLDARGIEGMARALEEIERLPDPVGGVDRLERRPNGLLVGRMSVPLGLVGIIYESRPNVTVEAAGLCVKSGNAVLLRGGKEAARTNAALAKVMRRALSEAGLPEDAVSTPGTDREGLLEMVGLSGILDLLIPRGGEGLIRFVDEHARVPVLRHAKGVCHVYVDGAADLAMAARIALDAKTHRPGVCNAMETLLVDASCAQAFLPGLVARLRARSVELRGDARARAIVPEIAEASAADWDTEYLDKVLSIAIVDGIDGALAHVGRHGTQHTEAIVTHDHARAQRWLREVDASLVLVNASTRWNDGGELGLGAEMGISTTKLHAYGPMGLAELCTRKWIAYGEGQTRGEES